MGQVKGAFDGVVARDAEMTTTQSGKSMTRFNLAVSLKKKGYADKPDQETTLWARVTLFDEAAQAASSLKKGHLVSVQGRLAWLEQHEKYGLQAEVLGDSVSFPEPKAKKTNNLPKGFSEETHKEALKRLKGSKFRATPHELDYYDTETDTVQCYDVEQGIWFAY